MKFRNVCAWESGTVKIQLYVIVCFPIKQRTMSDLEAVAHIIKKKKKVQLNKRR